MRHEEIRQGSGLVRHEEEIEAKKWPCESRRKIGKGVTLCVTEEDRRRHGPVNHERHEIKK